MPSLATAKSDNTSLFISMKTYITKFIVPLLALITKFKGKLGILL